MFTQHFVSFQARFVGLPEGIARPPHADILQKTQVPDLMTHQTLVEDVCSFFIIRFDTPNVVWILGLEVFHQSGHRCLELGASCRRPFQVDLGRVPLREQRLDEGVAGLPHGLGQVSVEKVIVLIHKSFHLVQYL